jgi:hypothetical protein
VIRCLDTCELDHLGTSIECLRHVVTTICCGFDDDDNMTMLVSSVASVVRPKKEQFGKLQKLFKKNKKGTERNATNHRHQSVFAKVCE